MDKSKFTFSMALIAAVVTIVLTAIGFFTDTGIWGTFTSRVVNEPVFFVILGLGVIALIAATVVKDDEAGSDAILIRFGIVISVAVAVIVFLTSSGGFFWRNLFPGTLSMFGSWGQIVEGYSDLPPDRNFVDLWSQSTWMRILSAVLGGVYTFLIALIIRELTDRKSAWCCAFMFVATVGVVAVFSRPGDFGVLALLFALNAYLTLRFVNARSSIYPPAVVLVLSAVFHPVFILFALALIYVRAAGPILASGKAAIPVLLLLAAIIAGAVLGILEPTSFVSVFRPDTTASPTFGMDHLGGFINHLVMVSHVLVLLAVVTFLYALLSVRLKDLRGMLVGVWFIASLAFSIFVYPRHGWIMGHAAAVVVVVPAALWLAYFISAWTERNTGRSFRPLTVTNMFMTVLLLISVNSSSSAQVFADYLDKDHAYDRSFQRGINALLAGIMFSEELEMYETAVPYLEEYRRSYPGDIVAAYHYGWALTNVKGRLVDGVELLDEVESKLVEQDKLFWEFNYRVGWKRMVGHNAAQGSIALERAAADSNTAQIANWLGIAYEILKVWDSMASKHQQAIDLGDSAREHFFKVADGSLKTGDTTRAIDYFKYGVENFPSYIVNYDFLAEHYFYTGRYDSLKALAEQGLMHLGRSRPLEACMILVYDKTGQHDKRDSLYNDFIDYFQIYPNALYEWGTFLEDNGLVYLGRKMQAADPTVDQDGLRAILGFYHYYKNHDMPDSARSIIERFDEIDSTDIFEDMIQTVRHYDTVLWPEAEYRLDEN